MKNVAKTILLIVTLIDGCRNMSYEDTLNNIEIQIENVKTKENGSTGFTVVWVDTLIKNLSKEKITKVYYEFQVYDKEDKLMKTYNFYYYTDDKSLDENQCAKDHHGFQDKFEEVPYSYKIKIINYKNIDEFPLVHVPQKGEHLYQILDDNNMKNIKNNLPINIHIHIDRMGMADVVDVSDNETIKRLVDLFCNIKIDKETDQIVTDNYNWISFKFEDNCEYVINLNLRNYETKLPSGYHIYELENMNEFFRYCKQLTKSE